MEYQLPPPPLQSLQSGGTIGSNVNANAVNGSISQHHQILQNVQLHQQQQQHILNNLQSSSSATGGGGGGGGGGVTLPPLSSLPLQVMHNLPHLLSGNGNGSGSILCANNNLIGNNVANMLGSGSGSSSNNNNNNNISGLTENVNVNANTNSNSNNNSNNTNHNANNNNANNLRTTMQHVVANSQLQQTISNLGNNLGNFQPSSQLLHHHLQHLANVNANVAAAAVVAAAANNLSCNLNGNSNHNNNNNNNNSNNVASLSTLVGNSSSSNSNGGNSIGLSVDKNNNASLLVAPNKNVTTNPTLTTASGTSIVTNGGGGGAVAIGHNGSNNNNDTHQQHSHQQHQHQQNQQQQHAHQQHLQQQNNVLNGLVSVLSTVNTNINSNNNSNRNNDNNNNSVNVNNNTSNNNNNNNNNNNVGNANATTNIDENNRWTQFQVQQLWKQHASYLNGRKSPFLGFICKTNGKSASNTKEVICGDDKYKEEGDLWNVEAQTAFLGPNLWDKTLPYDADLKVTQYADLDEFLSENNIPDGLPGPHLGHSGGLSHRPDSLGHAAGLSLGLGHITTKRERSPSPSDCISPDTLNPPSPAESTFSFASSGRDFDPRTRAFSDEELKPQPMIKKSRKQFVPDELKDDKYWARRRKNNIAAKRSRDARRQKENQIAMRARYLEKENATLHQEVEQLKQENMDLRARLSKFQDV